MNKRFRIQAFILLAVSLAACVAERPPLVEKNSELTQGNVQMNLVVGTSTKLDVLESFGSPNITTRDGNGLEVWSYQRQAQVSQSHDQRGYWTIIFAGQSSGTSGFETASRMMTLIIKFDERDVVTDFRSRTSNF